MWNLCSSSKLVSQREKQRSYDLHQEKLDRMKPKMKVVAPSQPGFVYAKHKLEMSRRDRLLEIDYQNDILLRKMKKISRDDYTTNKLRPEAQNLHTLNQVVSNQQAESINQENRRICQKLMKVNPYYPTLDIVDHADQLQRVSANISENARRSISTSNLRPHSSSHLRPQSSTSRSKFYRSKVSKYDQEGAATQEQFYKYFQVQSTQTLRPESAPAKPKQRRPLSSRPGQGVYRQEDRQDRFRQEDRYNEREDKYNEREREYKSNEREDKYNERDNYTEQGGLSHALGTSSGLRQ